MGDGVDAEDRFTPQVLRHHRSSGVVAKALASRHRSRNPFDPIETASFYNQEEWRAEQEAIGVSSRPLRDKVRSQTRSCGLPILISNRLILSQIVRVLPKS